MATETVVQLTDEQKIQILEGAKKLLGPNGENWTKSCWWGVKTLDSELVERLRYYGYQVDEVPDDDQLKEWNQDTEGEIMRRPLDTEEADEANVWCLMGALEEVAYRLGIVQTRHSSERLADPISLQNLVQSKEEWQGWSVIDVNDKAETTFEMVRGLIDERLAQLRQA